MKIFFSNYGFLYFCLVLASLFLGCKSNRSDISKNTIKVGIASDPSTLDPIYSVDLISQKINSLIFVKLFRFNALGNIEGELAQNYFFSGNKLRVKIHTPGKMNILSLKSKDIIYSLNRLRTEIGPRKSKYGFIKSFRKISEFELEIEFESANLNYLKLLALAPASIYQEFAQKENGSFVSSGIYSLVNWNKNESITLKLNSLDNKNLFPENLILQVLNQPSSAIYLFQKGNLDVMKIPYYLLLHPAVRDQPKKILKGKSVQYIAINQNNPCFDVNFRKALNYAIDRNIIIEKIFDSSASDTNASVTNEYLEPYTKEKFYYSYDLHLAKSFLSKSSCYPGILKKKLELRMRADDENKAKGSVLAQYFKALGLKITILPMEKTKLYKENGEKKGDLTLLTWFIDFDSVQNFIDPLFASDSFGNGGNRAFYSNSLVNDYIRQIRINPNDNLNLIEVIRVLKEDAPWVFLWSIHENYILSKSASRYSNLIDLIIN